MTEPTPTTGHAGFVATEAEMELLSHIGFSSLRKHQIELVRAHVETELAALREQHAALEKECAELRGDRDLIDFVARYWDSQYTDSQQLLGGRTLRNPDGSLRGALRAFSARSGRATGEGAK